MTKFSVKTFIVCFVLIALGGIVYGVVRNYIPIATLSVKEKGLIGMLCLVSYYLGNLAMFVFNRLLSQKAT